MEDLCASLPAELLEWYRQLFSDAEYQHILEAFSQHRHMTLRANTLKISASELQRELEQNGIRLQTVPWWENAFLVADESTQQIFHPLYVSGAMYVQSLSSMVPPLVLDPQPGEQVLDLTAAPGSKTTQMAALMQNTGEIIANDISPIRLFKLRANLDQQGVTNTFTRKGPGEFFWKRFPEYFDRALVDVPCGMEGRIQCDDPKTFENWSVRKIKELSLRQKHLLRSAVTATKPGGTIVYSTCTLAPEENEAVVNWLLEKEHGKVVLEEISPMPGLETRPGVTEWLGETYDPSLTKTWRILPSKTMEGFFVAKFKKLTSTYSPDQTFTKKKRWHHRRR